MAEATAGILLENPAFVNLIRRANQPRRHSCTDSVDGRQHWDAAQGASLNLNTKVLDFVKYGGRWRTRTSDLCHVKAAL